MTSGLAVCWMTLVIFAPTARATLASIGVLSYDTFIPPGGGSPGTDGFDFSNLTGAFSLPPDFPVTDSLTFLGASLILTPQGQTAETFSLGDIGPGPLVDGSGNPIVQVPGDQMFVSAEFVATLSPGQFMLYDGTTFAADSTMIDVLLLPSVGSTLTVDVDQVIITVSETQGIPEPGTGYAALIGLLAISIRSNFFRRPRKEKKHAAASR